MPSNPPFEIPATVIDNGDFKNVPYKSFRVNNESNSTSMAIPKTPPAWNLGSTPTPSDLQLRKILRGYLAGFLTTRQEIGTLFPESTKALRRRVILRWKSPPKMLRMPTAHGGSRFTIASIWRASG